MFLLNLVIRDAELLLCLQLAGTEAAGKLLLRGGRHCELCTDDLKIYTADTKGG